MSRVKLFQEILAAEKRLLGQIHCTPVYTSSAVNQKSGGKEVFFKCESLQKTGSFKARGALNAVLKAKEANPSLSGVVTHSSGNHGQALAWAARKAKVECVVVVPEGSPTVKCQAIQDYGARLVLCQPNPTARAAMTEQIMRDTGFLFIPPYDHYDVIAGQGTIAVEFLSQVPDLDAILVPISGGGMTSGIAIATKHLHPKTKGERLWTDPPKFVDTIADGIRLQQVGQLTFPLLCELAEKEVFTVTDKDMIEAMKFIWQRMKLVVEVSSAAGLAAVFSDRMQKELGQDLHKIGVILCGGNVDIDTLPW